MSIPVNRTEAKEVLDEYLQKTRRRIKVVSGRDKKLYCVVMSMNGGHIIVTRFENENDLYDTILRRFQEHPDLDYFENINEALYGEPVFDVIFWG